MRSASLAADSRTTEPHHPSRGPGSGAILTTRAPGDERTSAEVLHPETWGRHRWGKTPAPAPLRMEARRFELISWHDILRSVGLRLRVRHGSVFARLPDVGTRA